jgi:hypothetical protein
MYFDHDTMKWQTRGRQIEQVTPEIGTSHRSSDLTSSKHPRNQMRTGNLLDTSTMTWTTKRE